MIVHTTQAVFIFQQKDNLYIPVTSQDFGAIVQAKSKH